MIRVWKWIRRRWRRWRHRNDRPRCDFFRLGEPIANAESMPQAPRGGIIYIDRPKDES